MNNVELFEWKVEPFGVSGAMTRGWWSGHNGREDETTGWQEARRKIEQKPVIRTAGGLVNKLLVMPDIDLRLCIDCIAIDTVSALILQQTKMQARIWSLSRDIIDWDIQEDAKAALQSHTPTEYKLSISRFLQ